MSAPGSAVASAASAVGRRVSSGAWLVKVGWLTLVWLLLWGTFSWANLIGGLVVALVVVTAFPLPDLTGGRRLRPGGMARVLARVLADLVRSSAQVAWQSVRPGPPIRSSVVAVHLGTRSELLIAFAVETLSLVPGSVVVDTRPSDGVIYAHVLGADDDAAVTAFRRQVERLERDFEASGLGEVSVRVRQGAHETGDAGEAGAADAADGEERR